MDQETALIVDNVIGISSKSPEIGQFAVFDFDNTCIEHDIAEALLTYLCTNHLLKNNDLLDIAIEDIELYHQQVLTHYYDLLEKDEVKKAYQLTTQMIAGFTEAEINDLVIKTIFEEGQGIGTKIIYDIKVAKGLRVRENVIELLKTLQKNNITIWIVSASPETVVKAALTYYGIVTNCIGMRVEINNGIFTNAIIEPLSTMEGKVFCIQKYIHPTQQPILGIGDSMNDFPMISYSQIKVVVDRNNALAEQAKQNNWHIITA